MKQDYRLSNELACSSTVEMVNSQRCCRLLHLIVAILHKKAMVHAEAEMSSAPRAEAAVNSSDYTAIMY